MPRFRCRDFMFIVRRKQQVIPEIHSLAHFLPSQVAIEFCSLRNPHIHALAAEMHRTILDIRAIKSVCRLPI